MVVEWAHLSTLAPKTRKRTVGFAILSVEMDTMALDPFVGKTVLQDLEMTVLTAPSLRLMAVVPDQQRSAKIAKSMVFCGTRSVVKVTIMQVVAFVHRTVNME